MNDYQWSRFSRTALSVAVAIVAAAPALAQNTTSAVSGRVVGSDGKAVAGATVVIKHIESGSVNTVATDADGRYTVRGLRVGGPYVLTVSKGADTETRGDLFLALAETLNLDLRLGAKLATVEVSGTAVSNKFNSDTMGAGTSVSRKELDAYASIGRNLQDYARMDPRLAQTDKGQGNISALGQNARYNSITIDGVSVSDTFGLEGNQLPTVKQPISIDSIESVQVNISNYDVTQKGYTGANINAVTKSGTNDFKGSVYYITRSDKLVGDLYNRTNDTYYAQPSFNENTKGFTLGGPIIKDKLFFFTSYEQLTSSQSFPGYGPLGSSATNVGVTQSLLDGISQIAKSKYNYDIGSATGDGGNLVFKDLLVKLDWNISDKHRANIRYTKTTQDQPQFGTFNATSLELSSSWYDQKKNIETVVGQWFADWTPNFSTELKLSNRNYDSVPINNTYWPSITLSVAGPLPAGSPTGVSSNTRSVYFGTDYSRTTNLLRTQTKDAYFAGNLLADDHEVKFGVDLSDNHIYNAFVQNSNGAYTFKCDKAIDPTENCSTAAGVEAAILQNFQNGRASSYQINLPAQPGATLAQAAADWSLRNEGFFLQDTWTVNDKLTVMAGVRLDSLGLGQTPLYNAAAAAPVIAANPASNVRQTGGFGMDNRVTANGMELWQPRVGFNYVIEKAAQQRSQVRGGFGLFEGAAANVWLSNPFSNNGMLTTNVSCTTTNGSCPTQNGWFSPDPTKQPSSFAGVAPTPNIDFIQKGLNQPSVWKANLAWDRELPWYGMVFGAEYIYTQTNTGLYYQNLNLGAPTKIGSDGRQLFYAPQGYNGACWDASGAFISGGACAVAKGYNLTKTLNNASFGSVLMASSTNKGGGNTLTLSLSRPAQSGFGWMMAYTRSSATEVNPLQGSVSNTSWSARSVFNPNENVASNSDYLVRDRITGSLNWSKAFISSYKTTVGLFYEGRRGKPYSWTYANDLNGDGVSGNDLMYIPKGPQSGEVVFKGDTAANHPNEDRFWQIVNGYSDLRNAKGSVVARNSAFSPFINSFDLRLSQQLPGLTAQHKGVVTLDILNVGNLLNKKWGHIDDIAYASAGGQTRNFVNYAGMDANGHYIYSVNNAVSDYTTEQNKGQSQWAAQVTLRYEF